MRKIFIATFLFCLISCNEKTSKTRLNLFKGYGELLIGAKFDSIPSYKLFNKNPEGYFELDKYEISKEIGVIEDVVVKTKNGRIYDVSFSNGKYTDVLKLDEAMLKMQEESFSRDPKLDDEDSEHLFYKTYDGKISFSKVVYKDQDLAVLKGYYSNDYSYYDYEINTAIMDNERKIQDSVEKAEYMKDVKQLK